MLGALRLEFRVGLLELLDGVPVGPRGGLLLLSKFSVFLGHLLFVRGPVDVLLAELEELRAHDADADLVVGEGLVDGAGAVRDVLGVRLELFSPGAAQVLDGLEGDREDEVDLAVLHTAETAEFLLLEEE